MNKVHLVGRVALEPRLQKTGSGKPYMFLRIAVDGYFDRKAKEMTTDFIPVKLWGQEANKCRNLIKGSLISIEGRISVGAFVDQNGEKKFPVDIVADTVNFLSKPKGA